MANGSYPQYRVLVEKDVPMTTRDGVVLRADVYREDQATGTCWQTATQTIFHDQRYPSHILLPVIPR